MPTPTYDEGRESHLDWWMCKHCGHVWNERNTGPHWRPRQCPEQDGNHEATMQATRDKHNHDD